jgi:hypothetical protein
MNQPTVGVSADGLWIQYAHSLAGTDGWQVATRQLGGGNSIPNAILLPKVEGEPYRFDLGITSHPRGCGFNWPTEAIVDSDIGSGRLPIGCILNRIESGNNVVWKYGHEQNHTCTDALASAIAQVYTGHEGALVFVIPNSWNVGLQQSFLDAFQKENLKCKLLWRPVAASLEWSSHFQNHFSTLVHTKGTTIGKLLSVYVGYGEFEVTELDLVVWENRTEQKVVVPGRGRPHKQERIPSFGFRQIIHKLSSEIGPNRNPLFEDYDRLGHVWNKLWCSRDLERFLASFRFQKLNSVKMPDDLEKNICQTPQIHSFELQATLQQLRSSIRREYAGIVISGPLANCSFDDASQIGNWVLNNLNTRSDLMLVEGQDVDKGLLARGAFRFAHRLEQGLPTYLDTLPRLEMVILEKGEPTWIDLLEREQKWVEGGREWRRPERVQNLSIAPSSIDLKLAIAHEDFEHVREVVTKLPHSTKETEKVSLSVVMTPAQGNARIEIHPEDGALFGNRRVFMDWKHMTAFLSVDDMPTSKDGYLNAYPRIFPELLPRVSSASKIRSVEGVLFEIMDLMRKGGHPKVVNQRIRSARGLLREKDQKMYPQDATAFDSEGNCASSFKLKEFMDVAWPYFQKHQPNEFVRAIAYTHVDHAAFHKLLIANLQSWGILEDHVVAAGKCLRSPDQVATFIRVFEEQYNKGLVSQVWWKALSEILRFRGNALQNVSSNDCLALVRMAGKVFMKEKKKGEGREAFRLACLVIVYTLRRRAFDDSFLAPESDLAISIKNEFREARAHAKAGILQLMGGSINLPQQLQLIIDYIDRKGKGQLLISE